MYIITAPHEVKNMFQDKNTKYTKFKYTQPVYMNGMDAPFVLAMVPAWILMKPILAKKITVAATLSIGGICTAAVIFMLMYSLVLRRMLLNGGLPLKFHDSKYRALPFSFVVWILFDMCMFYSFAIDWLLEIEYPNKIFFYAVPLITSFALMCVCFYWVAMVGETPIEYAKQKLVKFTSTVSERYQYKTPEVPKKKPQTLYGLEVDENGFVKTSLDNYPAPKTEEKKQEAKSKETLKKLSKEKKAKPIQEEDYEFPTKPKMKKDEHLNGIVDRRKR